MRIVARISSRLLPAHSTIHNIRYTARVVDLDMSIVRRNRDDNSDVHCDINYHTTAPNHMRFTLKTTQYTVRERQQSLFSDTRSQTARRREEGSAGSTRYCLRCLSSTRTVSTRRIIDDSSHLSHR